MKKIMLTLTRSISAAREELRQNREFVQWENPTIARMEYGKNIIVSVDNPEAMRGLEVNDYDIHPSAVWHRRFHEAVEIAKSRKRNTQ
jgi:hypothetical protein